MTRYLTRDRAAIAAAVGAPLAAALVLLPWCGSWSNTNVALLLVVVVVAVAAIGNRAAGDRTGQCRCFHLHQRRRRHRPGCSWTRPGWRSTGCA